MFKGFEFSSSSMSPAHHYCCLCKKVVQSSLAASNFDATAFACGQVIVMVTANAPPLAMKLLATLTPLLLHVGSLTRF
ncbi:hypothetical protein FRX31_021278 [Thalictrum thalictroides]|uniref:Uncharacterized protein n=1 Tax=Thalictrum thalictroides TaxID=46969 RepID=A0A7J6VVK4_THATH|nr:hypothetical protein FRX31_021278 [Thalictrum thalictroides]